MYQILIDIQVTMNAKITEFWYSFRIKCHQFLVKISFAVSRSQVRCCGKYSLIYRYSKSLIHLMSCAAKWEYKHNFLCRWKDQCFCKVQTWAVHFYQSHTWLKMVISRQSQIHLIMVVHFCCSVLCLIAASHFVNFDFLFLFSLRQVSVTQARWKLCCVFVKYW